MGYPMQERRKHASRLKRFGNNGIKPENLFPCRFSFFAAKENLLAAIANLYLKRKTSSSADSVFSAGMNRLFGLLP